MPAFFASEGMPFWNELRTYDLDRSSDFYQGLFGWDIDSADNSGYYYARKQGMPIAGIIPVTDDTASHQPNQWMLSFLTDDVRAVAHRSREYGGTAGEPVDGPRGPMVAATDIVGAQLGFIHPASEPFIAGGEPGTPVWHELAAILPEGVSIDDVAVVQRVSPVGFNLAIDLDAPRGNHFLCLTTGFNEAGQFNELTELN